MANADGTLSQRPGPVHLNFCFRENLAPDAGPVRGAPGRNAAWSKAYVSTLEMHRWAEGAASRSVYVPQAPSLPAGPLLDDLSALAASGRVVVLVGAPNHQKG